MLTSRVASVDPRVLRILNLQANTEVDYQTYASMLKNAATTARGSSSNMTTEEIELITQEFRKARSNAMGVGGRIKLIPIKTKIANINTGRLKRNAAQAATSTPTQPLLPSSKQDIGALGGITKSLGNIIQLLTQQNQQVRKDSDENRKTQERAKRAGLETNLERGFVGAKVAAQALIAPVKNILDQIIQYFVMIFLGRAIISLLNWFADPQNQSKVRSILRFLSDWWPTLMSAYILFGTGFGRVVRKLAGVAVGAVSRLIIITARLVKAIATGKGLKGAAAAVATGGGGAGWKGALVKLGVGALATVGTTVAVNKVMSSDGQDAGINVPEAPQNPMLGAVGGGLASLGSLFGNLTSGASESFAPFTAFFSNGGLADVMQGLGGVVSGQKGIDKVPAMLTDGEFVMSRGAVQKFGVNTLESMNAAGGGTNIPKVVRGRIHAAGGGYIGSAGMMGGVEELRQKYDVKHGAGSYNRESARRRAAANQGESPREVLSRLRGYELPKKKNEKSIQTPSINPRVNIPQVKIPTSSIPKSPKQNYPSRLSIKLQNNPEMMANKKARSEYLAIIKNMDHPDYQKAWDDPKYLDKLRNKYRQQANPQTPATSSKKEYKPYISPFAGSRDNAFANAKKITGVETSQQRLDRLSSKGAGVKSGRGIRYTTEAKASAREDIQRGGVFGQLGRGFTRMFGSEKDKARIASQDAASSARVKQAGAASIGKYYSSSDGKYYGNYEQAQKARQARLATTKPNARPITPTPKPAPKVVRTKANLIGSGGASGGKGTGARPSVPQFPASSGSNRKQKNVYGIR